MDYITTGYPKSACRGIDLVLDTRETLTTNKVFLKACHQRRRLQTEKLTDLNI